MALRGAAARRYAQAVFDIAKEQDALDKWLTDLRVIRAIFGTESAVTALEDPSTTSTDQMRIIDEHVKPDMVSPLALNLLRILVERNRIGLLPGIVDAYQDMFNKAKGIVVAEVTSAVPLDEAHQREVTEQLSRITGKTIELHLKQDPKILGGIIARIGDELIDASVATRLSELAERLA